MKSKLITFLQKNINKNLDYEKLLENPKIESHGDFALPMFILSKELKKNPVQISKEYQEKLTKILPDFIKKITAEGPYLNFYVKNSILTQQILNSIADSSIFQITDENPQKILIEFPSPNTNKPLHLGHLRNILIGKSLSLILEKIGHKITKVNLNNDRGIAICKSMLTYKLYGNKKTPQSENIKSDHFVGNFYTMFEQKLEKHPELEKQAQKMLQNWENGDKQTRELWEKMNSWALKGHKETLNKFKIKHDKEYFESNIYEKGKEIILKNLKNGIFEKDEKQNIICDLEKEGLGKKVLLRSDGTSIYITQDIALAYQKSIDFPNIEKYIFIVGNEQKHHFKVLFKILEKLGLGQTEKFYHFAYGYLLLPEGKMSSRKGTVIQIDTFLDELTQLAKEGLIKRSAKLTKKELQERAEKIGIGAAAFSILKINPLSDTTFNPKESLSFEGETGPYLQYTYARIQSVLKKADYKKNTNINYELFTPKEISLIKQLKEYPQAVLEAGKKYKISQIANYLIKTAQYYNEFYQSHNILKEEEQIKKARLLISYATAKIIKDGLTLLGIEILEEM